MPSKVSTVNFGAANDGLTTVGYVIYNEDETVYQARTTNGVSELGTNTGIYRVTITYPNNFRGMILWDTGEVTAQYAAESINPLDPDSIADEVRTMLRSLNTSLSSHLERLLKGKRGKSGEPESDKITSLLLGLKEKLDSLFPHVSTEVGKIEFSPEINPVVNIDMAQMIQCVSGINEEIKNSKELFLGELKERNEALKTLLIASKVAITDMIKPTVYEYRGIVNHLKSLSGDFRKSSSGVFTEVREIERKYDIAFDKKVKFIEAVLNRAVDSMIGEIVHSVTKLTEKLNQKSQAQETLEKIMEAIGEAIQKGKFNPVKNRLTPEQTNILLGLYR